MYLICFLHLRSVVYIFYNRYLDSEKRFQHVLEACGVNKTLMKLGVKEGDTVIVGEVSYLLSDSHIFNHLKLDNAWSIHEYT